MNHMQAVTVLEASHPDNIGDSKNSVTVKRHVYKDSNNNVQVTKESLNATTPTPSVDEPEEYTLLGIFKFKSPIKWLNTISIILIHLIFVYGFLTYPLKARFLTTLWGKLPKFSHFLRFIKSTRKEKDRNQFQKEFRVYRHEWCKKVPFERSRPSARFHKNYHKKSQTL